MVVKVKRANHNGFALLTFHYFESPTFDDMEQVTRKDSFG